jgi:hypothetical protein
MGAVWLVFGAKLRRHWRSWLLLTVLIAIVSGFVLAATAAGNRTDSASRATSPAMATTRSCTPTRRCLS